MIPNTVKISGTRPPTGGLKDQQRKGTGLTSHPVNTSEVGLSRRSGSQPSAAKGLASGPVKTTLGGSRRGGTPSFAPNNVSGVTRGTGRARRFGPTG